MKITLPQLLYGVLAFSTSVFCDSTKSFILCTTLLGGASKNPVPSKTFALTVTSVATLKITTTPVSTITPAAITNTVSETTTITSTTTKIQATNTYSSTTTTTLISTTTSVISNTVTATKTVTSTFTGTTTIPTSPGFTPAASEAHNPPAKRAIKSPRRIEKRDPKYSTQCTAGKDGQPTFSPALYPTQVVCGGVIEVVKTTTRSFTASTTATVTGNAPPASSTTTTFSTTVTRTVVPAAASTTLTVTSTASSTSTVFSTTTSTVTSTVTHVVDSPQATFYAACGPDNQLSTVDGQNIYGFGTGSVVTQQGNVNSAYDCCVACITNPTCGTAFLFSGTSPVCYQVAGANGQCNPKVQVVFFYTRAGAPLADYISTGNCGAIALGSTT